MERRKQQRRRAPSTDPGEHSEALCTRVGQWALMHALMTAMTGEYTWGRTEGILQGMPYREPKLQSARNPPVQVFKLWSIASSVDKGYGPSAPIVSDNERTHYVL